MLKKIKKLLCKIGIHTYSKTEVHICQKPPIGDTYKAAIMERCDCGDFRTVIGKRTTQTCISSKYMSNTHHLKQ